MPSTIVLPGDIIPEDQIPHNSKRKLALGPGLRFAPPATIVSTVSGTLNSISQKKNTIWVDSRGGKYIPSFDDPVVVRVTGTVGEAFACSLSPYTSNAILPHLSFENATKKTKPNLAIGALVYARVASSTHDLLQQSEAELTCINPHTTRADGLGPLKGGMTFPISLEMARRMLLTGRKARENGQVVILERLGAKWQFEVAIGRNGLIWIDVPGGDVERVIAIGNAVVECDEKRLTIEEQEKLAAGLLRNS